ncbi:ribose-phosphate diphosphokinase [Candidatus Uhrbacteria bacterium]|nr:ribose-phosphate diphosphokinase [Candidatus Uhrbacteria bacterium]
MTEERKTFNGKLFCGQSNVRLAQAIGAELAKFTTFDGKVDCVAGDFHDEEPDVQFTDNVRDADVFLIQSTNRPGGKNLVELLAMANAAKLADAGKITAVMPYFGYARQDRKVRARTPITAQAVCMAIEALGVDRILTTDLHSGQVEGMFRRAFPNLEALPLLLRKMRIDLGLNFSEMTFVSPDKGGVVRCDETGKLVGCTRITFAHKSRSKTDGELKTMRIVDPDLVEGRDCLLIDDLVDTGGTLAKAAGKLKEAGARRVLVACVHPVLSADRKTRIPAMQVLGDAPIDAMYFADTIPLSEESLAPFPVFRAKLHTVSSAPLFAGAIAEIHLHGSVSGIFRRTAKDIFQD